MSIAAKLIGSWRRGQATFIGATTRQDAGAISWPGGIAAGDTAIIASSFNGPGPVLSTSGWAKTTYNASSSYLILHMKVLTAGDISSPPTIDQAFSGVHTLIHRGANALAARSNVTKTSGDNTLTIPGFDMAAASRGVVNISMDRTDGVGHPAGTPPAGMTVRSSTVPGVLWSMRTADSLTRILNGEAFLWTDYYSTATARIGVAIELYRA